MGSPRSRSSNVPLRRAAYVRSTPSGKTETKQEWSYIGSTAAVALLMSPDSGFGFAQDGAAVRLTTDHKAPDKA